MAKTADKQGGSKGRVMPKGKPFTPGQSGNPKGRPRNEFSITALLREAMDKREIAGVPIPVGKTVGEAIRDKFLDEAINGADFRFIKEVLDRIDGKPKEPEGQSATSPIINLTIKDDFHRKPKPDA